ncbi:MULTISPECIES: Wadjet anti-phage system protein JetD domain-containing protein [unclassified Cryobacterium]|uniref:Wadjet anti-phage system protein JetD domain-containing protein n=1 Tax=unclassified Cryobacterium TaxID=2649013 RepID=UPI000CE2C7E7|nr:MULTISPECIES: DUF3322 and DUF2220 domain-containing protein [unclassified Cryobacterium]
MTAEAYAAVLTEARTIYERKMREWAQASNRADGFPVRIPIRELSANSIAADAGLALGRARAWSEYTGPGRVETVRRKWPYSGVLDVPHRLTFETAGDIAEFTGERRSWAASVRRITELRASWPDVRVLPAGVFTQMMSLADGDWATLLSALRWAETNDPSGFLVRQLPIPGADTKWVQRHWLLVEKLSGFGARLNPDPLAPISTMEKMTFTRILDATLRAQIGGLGLFTAPPTELAKLPLTPTVVIICENLQNGHAFTDRPGTVVLAGKGFDVPAYARIPWLQEAQILYWGDIDTHGFAILNRLRAYLPATSILMDEGTLLRNRVSWVAEDVPTAARLENLTDTEQLVYQSLVAGKHGRHVRFEQERVPWADVTAALDECGSCEAGER